MIQAVASLPEVAAIYPNGKGALKLPPQTNVVSSTKASGGSSTANLSAADPNPEPGLVKTNADDAWALGFEGQGVVVAGADTGVRWTHAALKNQYRGWNGSTASHDYNWHDAIHLPNWPAEPLNPCNPGGVLGAGQPSPSPAMTTSFWEAATARTQWVRWPETTAGEPHRHGPAGQVDGLPQHEQWRRRVDHLP